MGSISSLKIEEQVQAAPARPPEPPRAPSRRWVVWTAGGLALALVLALVLAIAHRGRRVAPAATAAPTAYAAATRGKLVRSVRVGGVLAAVHFASVGAPPIQGQAGQGGPQLTVISFAAAGSKVKQGDVLAELERQAQLNFFEERQSEYISLTDQIAKRRAELDIEREKQQTDLQKARADLEAAKLENKRNEVISRIDAEKNQQTLAEAEATAKMLEQTLKLREAAAEAELKLLEVRRERERLQMEYARVNYERLIIRSPIPGMVVLPPIWKGGRMGVVQEGDQVRPGMVFLQVVDSSSMIVRARVNQLDTALLPPGGRAEVRLDAYPELSFPGRVESAGTLGRASEWSRFVKTFPVVFSVEGSDPRLIPDISASVDVELEQVPDTVMAPRSAVAPQAGSHDAGFVWVKRGDRTEVRAVTLGPKNDTHWAIKAGLKEGEIVALYPPNGSGESMAGADVRAKRTETQPEARPNAKPNTR